MAAAKKAADAENRTKKAADKENMKKAKQEAKAAAKVAAKGKAKGTEKVMKRPAKAVDAVKIPSKILKINMKDVFKKLRERRKELSYKNFTNIASDHGYKRAKDQGAGYDVYRAFGRLQYRKAADIWNGTI